MTESFYFGWRALKEETLRQELGEYERAETWDATDMNTYLLYGFGK